MHLQSTIMNLEEDRLALLLKCKFRPFQLRQEIVALVVWDRVNEPLSMTLPWLALHTRVTQGNHSDPPQGL